MGMFGGGVCVCVCLLAPMSPLALSFIRIKYRVMQSSGTLVYLNIDGTFCRSRASYRDPEG